MFYEITAYNNISRNYTDLFRHNVNLIKQLDSIQQSKAYRIGNLLIKPVQKIFK